MTDNTEALPCPFCGAAGVTVHEGSTFRWRYAACDHCGAQTGEVRVNTMSADREKAEQDVRSEAIAAWNTRAALAQQAATPAGDLTVPPPMPEPEMYAGLHPDGGHCWIETGDPSDAAMFAADQLTASDAIWSERVAALLRAVPPLPVVAWLYNNGWASVDRQPHYAGEAPLVRKADAEAALASLQARLEAAERDAARYETIRAMLVSLVLRTPKGSTITLKAPDKGQVNGAGLDAAIDGLLSVAAPPATPAAQPATFLLERVNEGDPNVWRYAAPPAAQAGDAWISVEDRLPEPGFPVLVACGKKVLRAAHAPRFTLAEDTWGDFSPDGGEYDEATDATYWPEGWYEWNVHEETHWQLDDEPTHWRPLPDAPRAALKGQPEGRA